MSDARAADPRGGASALDPRSEAQPSEAASWLDLGVPLPPPGRMTAFEAGGQRLVLCNAGGVPYVVQDRCPHAFATLSDGRLEGCVLECPLHGGRLDVRDGRP